MKQLFSILIDKNSLNFGLADNNQERDEFQKLRYEIYKNHNYLNENIEKIDKDEYDRTGTKYIICEYNNTIVGGLRLIYDEYLPTEKDCFEFIEPVEMSKYPRNRRVEIGRLVVKRVEMKNIPRNLIMLGLFYSSYIFNSKNKIEAGYSFIKKSLFNKLKKINAPFHEINNYKVIYNKKTLEKYFNDKNNYVVPIYFILEEFKEYSEKIFTNRLLFKKVNNNTIKLRNSFIWNIIRRAF